MSNGNLIECRSNGNFAFSEYLHPLCLKSQLFDLRGANANPYRAKLKFAKLANHSNKMLGVQSASGFDPDGVSMDEKKHSVSGVLFSMVTRTGIEPMLQP